MMKIPENFIPSLYEKYNPDLKGHSEEWLIYHYINYGIKENRIYKIDLPKKFDVDVYRQRNLDLLKLDDVSAKIHYCMHGKLENRPYKDELFDKHYFTEKNINNNNSIYKTYLDDIRQIKSKKVQEIINNIKISETEFILVNHNHKINGASHSLYVMAEFLKQKKKTFIILETKKVSKEIYKKYNIENVNLIYYHDDPTILYWMCKNIKHSRIIFNSINFSISHAMKWLPRNDFILFSREIKDHYMNNSCYFPDVVITSQIAKSYERGIIVQTPILPPILQEKIDIDYKKEININLNPNKITLGMCGMFCKRKNIDLFLQVAQKLQQYNFLWIGGEDDIINCPNNVFHIKDTLFPYKYYRLLDYFVLFSEQEPFGNVILENLYINNKILTFKENVFFDFKNKLTKDNYFEYEGHINLHTAVNHILNKATQKKDHSIKYKNSDSHQYVVQNFSNYNKTFLDFLFIPQHKHFFNNTKNITDFNNINVQCPDGFCNQLRLLLAGYYLRKHNYIENYNQEWIVNNHNNVKFLDYFQPPNGINFKKINNNISYNNVINTTTFKQMINVFSGNRVRWLDAFADSIKCLKLKKSSKVILDSFIENHDIKNTLGLHIRRTCKTSLSENKDKINFMPNEVILENCQKYDKVFLATDNKETQEWFAKKLHSKIIIYKEITRGDENFTGDYDRNKVERHTGGEHAVMDFLILKHCHKFIGTESSSFSSLIYFWRNCKEDFLLTTSL